MSAPFGLALAEPVNTVHMRVTAHIPTTHLPVSMARSFSLANRFGNSIGCMNRTSSGAGKAHEHRLPQHRADTNDIQFNFSYSQCARLECFLFGKSSPFADTAAVIFAQLWRISARRTSIDSRDLVGVELEPNPFRINSIHSLLAVGSSITFCCE